MNYSKQQVPRPAANGFARRSGLDRHKMRILVTGSHGYIGSVLAPSLASAGHEVVGLDTFFYDGCDFGVEDTPVTTLRADVRDVGIGELEGFDAVVHLAALSNDPLGNFDPALTAAINADAAISLAHAASLAGVGRFIFASSCSMYGASGSDDQLDENAPLRPLTAYAESKVRAEEGIFELGRPGFAPVSMRNATVYGVSRRLRLDIVLNNLAAWSHTTGRIRLLSDGSAWRPLVHVRDVAAVTLALLEAPEDAVRGQAINVGTAAQNYKIRELAEVLSDISGCSVEIAEGATPDRRSYRVDFSKLGRMLPDLSLSWDAERGSRELIDSYRTAGLTWDEFDGDRYTRLARLQHLVDSGALDDELRWRAGSPAA
jgi:nucleoside-diphosphate-sugar epimerase